MSVIREEDPAMWPAVCLLAVLLAGAWLIAQAPPPVGAMGDHRWRPDACEGYLLAWGTVDAAPHQLAEGYFAIGESVVLLHPAGLPYAHTRDLLGAPVEVVIRKVRPREQPRLVR
jgi:hypothetical protein